MYYISQTVKVTSIISMVQLILWQCGTMVCEILDVASDNTITAGWQRRRGNGTNWEWQDGSISDTDV